MKKPYIAVIIIIVLVGLIYVYTQTKSNNPVSGASFNGKNSSFIIDGEKVQLKNGVSQTEAAPGSASKVTTTYFGNEAKGDLNADGKEDIAFLVSQATGGSGLFYYVVVALRTDTGYKTINVSLIGDRIAPQATEIKSGQLVVNYAERASGQPMSAQPSVGVTKILKLNEMGVLQDVGK